MDDSDLFSPISSKRTSLRCPRHDDAATVARLVTPAISRWLASWPAPMNEQAAADRIIKARDEITSGQALHFLVEQIPDQTFMGWIRISLDKAHSGVGDLSYWLSEAYHNQGYASEAVHLAVIAAFEQLKLDSIEAGAQAENVASFSVMRRLGMEPCGERLVWASARSREELCFFYSVTRDKFAKHLNGRQSSVNPI